MKLMKLALVLTNDWELFGDGSGDFFDIQYQPLSETLDLLDKYGAKLTVMAEVGQQFSHIEHSAKYPEFSKITAAWEYILKETVARGQDVQLHYHPQWLGARYAKGEWSLNMDRYRLASLSQDEIETEIRKGKQYLEDMLQHVQPSYLCSSFRAGALCLQPSEHTLPALARAGIKCDVSVTKGKYSNGFYDFRGAHSNVLPWFSNGDILKSSGADGQMLELPIYSVETLDSAAMKKFMPASYYPLKYRARPGSTEIEWERERDIVKQQRYPREKRFYKKNEKRDLSWYRKAFLSKSVTHLDYDYLPATVFVKLLDNLYKSRALAPFRHTDLIIPVIASGHVKDMHTTENLGRILKLLQQNYSNHIIYMTLSQACDYVRENIGRYDLTMK